MSEGKFELKMGLSGTAQVMTGIESVINMIGQLTDKLKEWAKEAESYRRAVEGHTVSVREADEATSGLIDTVKLHQAAARLQAANVQMNERQFTALAAAAASYSRTTGKDLNESFDRLTQSVIASTMEGLRPFGIALEEQGTLVERQRRIVGALEEQYADFRIEVETTAEAAYQLENAWGTMWAEMLNAAERNSGPIRDILMMITGWVNNVTAALETERRAMASLANQGTELAQRQSKQRLRELGVDVSSIRVREGQISASLRSQTLDPARGWQRIINANSIEEFIRDFAPGGESGWGGSEILNREIQSELRNLIRLEREGNRTPVTSETTAPTLELEIPTETRRGGGGRRPRTRGLSGGLTAEDIDAEIARIQDLRDAMTEADREWENYPDRLQELIVEGWEEATRLEIEAADKAAEAVEESYERKAEAADRAAQLIAKAEEETRETYQKTINTLGLVNSAYDTTANVFSQVMAAKREDAEGNEDTLKKIARAEGTFLVAFNAAKGATETALAIAAAAAQEWEAAVMHGLAAAGHFAAMGIASSQLGSNRGGGSTTTANIPNRAHGGGGSDAYSSTGSTTVVNINGPVTSRRVNEELGALERDSDRRH